MEVNLRAVYGMRVNFNLPDRIGIDNYDNITETIEDVRAERILL